MFYTWGRLTGEVLGYSYRNQANCPPTSYRPQKFQSYHNHNSYKNLDSDRLPYYSLNDKSFQLRLVQERELPLYPRLSGAQFIHSPSGFSLFHLVEDGSILAQGYSTLEPLPDRVLLIDNAINEIEKKVIQEEVQSVIEFKFPYNVMSEHVKIDLLPFLNLLQPLSETISTKVKLELLPSQEREIKTLFLYD